LGWLEQIGMKKHESTFTKNDITGLVLPYVTIDDLKEIEIHSLGDRYTIYHHLSALLKSHNVKRMLLVKKPVATKSTDNIKLDEEKPHPQQKPKEAQPPRQIQVQQQAPVEEEQGEEDEEPRGNRRRYNRGYKNYNGYNNGH